MRKRLLLALSVVVGILAGAGVASANTIYPQAAPRSSDLRPLAARATARS